MKINTFRSRSPARAVSAALFAASSLAAIAPAHAADPVIFSFATVGDSRQDPTKPDATTLLAINPTTGAGATNLNGTLLPQDAEWLQNSKAATRILRSVAAEKPNLLFFNGDMIFGYGRPIPPVLVSGGCSYGAGGAAVTCPAAYSDYTNTIAYPSASGDNYAAVWYQTAAQQTASLAGAWIAPDFAFNAVEYAYWRGMVANTFETGTYVIPVPGNHETQCNNTKAPWVSVANPVCASGTFAYPENENAFRANMGDLIQDLVTNIRFSNVSGFKAQNVTGLTQATAPTGSASDGTTGINNQAELTYSFEVTLSTGEILHFDVINTDPSGIGGGGTNPTTGQPLPLSAVAPTAWLATDLAAAQARATAAGVPIRYFVFGHKPAISYNFEANTGGNFGADGLDGNPQYGNPFWSLMVQYNAAYFCGHEHIPNVAKVADPTGTYPGTATHVIVGSGGSPFDDTLTSSKAEPLPFNEPSDRSYAWALVQVHQSGAVSLTLNGFSDGFGPTSTFTWYNTSL
jgi:hypothetical protein